MKPELQKEIIDGAMSEIRALMTEHMAAIDKSLQSMYAEHESDKQFKYPVNLGIVIEPHGPTAKVSAKISYSVKHSDESIGVVADPDQMKMDLEDE